MRVSRADPNATTVLPPIGTTSVIEVDEDGDAKHRKVRCDRVYMGKTCTNCRLENRVCETIKMP